MKLKVGSGGVPVGNYTATFAGIEEQPPNPEKGYGPGLRWRFTITAGPQAGQVASRITSLSLTPKNGCGKMIAGLLGRAIAEGEEFDPEAFVGRAFMVVVGAGQSGGTRVEAIVPMPPQG